MKSYGTLVGELPTGIEFVVEGALLRIYFDFERREATAVPACFFKPPLLTSSNLSRQDSRIPYRSSSL